MAAGRLRLGTHLCVSHSVGVGDWRIVDLLFSRIEARRRRARRADRQAERRHGGAVRRDLSRRKAVILELGSASRLSRWARSSSRSSSETQRAVDEFGASRRRRQFAGGGLPLPRRSEDARAEGRGRPHRYGRRGRVSCRPKCLQGQARGQIPLHGPIDPGETAARLRSGNRGQSRKRAEPLPPSAAHNALRRRAQDRRNGRGRGMGRAYAAVRREHDARPGRRARGPFGWRSSTGLPSRSAAPMLARR